MKRYDIFDSDSEPFEEVESELGYYVKCEDAARILAQRDRLAELLRRGKRVTFNVCDVMEWERDRDAALAELDKEKQS